MADSFSFIVNDSSPALNYFPFADTLSVPNLFAGWNPCFSISACSTFPGQEGNGTSFHVTSLDGAAFSVQWWGNGIELSGLVTGNITYDLQLDGLTNSTVSPSSGTTLLAAYDNLLPTNHTLSLTVHNPSNSSYALIAIDHALIKVNSTSPNVTFSTTTVDDTVLPFTGRWSFLNDSVLSPLDSTFHTTSNAGDFVTLNFTGTAVTVFGFRDASSGNFSVQLDNETVVLNGASSFQEATTLFFRTGLNNSFLHTLTITNEDNGLLAIGSVNITEAVSSNSPNPGSALSSHVSRGTVIAITLAAVLGSLLLLISFFSLWRRRRHFGRILHQRRLFVAPSRNNHSKVLDIVRGPEVDDFDDMYEDKGPVGISRPTATNGSGSLSFTLDLPIQSRPSLPASQRGDYSGNSAQELPRSPTVSLGRTGTHAMESTRGVPLQDVSVADGSDNSGARRPPLPEAQRQATNKVVGISAPPQDPETREHFGRRAFELTPVVPAPAFPRVSAVAGVIPTPESSDRSQPSYSFLDITASSRGSSVRQPGPNASSSSSSSGSMRQRSYEPFSPTRRISLPFAMGYSSGGLRDRNDPSDPSSTNIEFPRISMNIRPLPQIPQGAVRSETESPEIPRPLPRRTVRPHAQSTPPLHVRTHFEEPQQLPRSVSATTAPTSALSSSNRVPHIIIHPSSLLRLHPRNTSAVSPTESVPVTVSDIHFRHSSDDEPAGPDSRRTSAGVGEHPPPHPPLPQRSYTSPFIMQKLFGSQASPPADGQIPLQTPGAGPSRLRDRDPPGSPSPSGLGRPSS